MRQLVYFLDRPVVLEGLSDGEDPFLGRHTQQLFQFSLLEVLARRNETVGTHSQHPTGLLERFGETTTDGHHFPDTLHLTT